MQTERMERPESSNPTQDEPGVVNDWEITNRAEVARDLAALPSVPRPQRSWIGQDHLPAPGEWSYGRVERAKDLGYLLQIEELPQWAPQPCSECPPGSPPLSREGHDAAHEWHALCQQAHHPFVMITLYHSPRTSTSQELGRKGKVRTGSASNGVVLLDVGTMEHAGTETVGLTRAYLQQDVAYILKELGIKATMGLIDKHRLRIETTGANAVYAGLRAVNAAIRRLMRWKEEQTPV